MLSIIIPTMQKDLEVLTKLLNQLQDSDSVGEIILIDNSCKGFSCNLSKVKVFVQKDNLFENPAWNLGIKLSSKDIPYFGILNDDIIFPNILFKQVDDFLAQANQDVGLVGIDCVANTPKSQFDTYPIDAQCCFEPINKLYGFFGSAFFGKKENYYEIPNEMKVFYGDHFLFTRNQQNQKQNYVIKNIMVKHLESLTSHSSKIIKKLFKSDRKICIKYNGVEHQQLSFLQRLFSITYYHNHYVFCLLGLKMKFKAARK